MYALSLFKRQKRMHTSATLKMLENHIPESQTEVGRILWKFSTWIKIAVIQHGAFTDRRGLKWQSSQARNNSRCSTKPRSEIIQMCYLHKKETVCACQKGARWWAWCLLRSVEIIWIEAYLNGIFCRCASFPWSMTTMEGGPHNLQKHANT